MHVSCKTVLIIGKINRRLKMISFIQYLKESTLILEGKHWPEDYIKTAKNIIKTSPLGQQSWYSDQYIDADLQTFANDFQSLSHKNSNLGFFSPLIKWFVEYSGSDKNKYQEFIEGKLDNIIRTLQQISNDKSYDSQRESIKKMSFKDFEKFMSDILVKDQADSDAKLTNIQKKDDYELIPIYSYDELHDRFGGNKTGYNGESEWCHTNGKGTYDSNAWTNYGKNMFFVLAKKDWQNIKPNKTDNAFDEYGTSLIAILVDVSNINLKAETLRWNHVIDPSIINPGSSVDHAFKDNWGDLSQLVGFNVKNECEKYYKKLKEKLKQKSKNINKKCEKILSNVDKIDKNTISDEYKSHITSITIPNNIRRIGNSAFYGCKSLKEIIIPNSVRYIDDDAFVFCESLKEIIIPNSVIYIGHGAFYGCKSLKEIIIPDSVTNIGNDAFYDCKSLTSITISNNITRISEWAFRQCNSLKSIIIPDKVKFISTGTFSDCKSLTSIIIPNGVISIGDFAFNFGESLTSITIPDSVRSIGDNVFTKCFKLDTVIFSDKSSMIDKIQTDYKKWGLELNQIYIKKTN